MITFIIALIVFVAAVVFAVQNAVPVAVSFFFWDFQASLAIVILVAFSLGILLGLIVFLISGFRRRMSESKENALPAESNPVSEQKSKDIKPEHEESDKSQEESASGF